MTFLGSRSNVRLRRWGILTAGQVCRHADEARSSASPWLTDVELGLHSVQGRGLASAGQEPAANDQYRRASWYGSRAASVASATFVAMTAHPAEPVPDADPDEAAVAAAALREYREWVAKGRPGAVSHEEAMAELLGDAQ